MRTLTIETGIQHASVKSSPSGSKCIVFKPGTIQCYELANTSKLLWTRTDLNVVDCEFIDESGLLLSTLEDAPLIVSATDGKDGGQIDDPVQTTLRTKYGNIYSHSDGRLYLRTSHPFRLVELNPQTLAASKSLAAESLSNVVFHPERGMFAGVVDAAAQELVIGSFESTPFYCNASLYLLPYLHSLGLSNSGRYLHVLGGDGEQTKLAVVDLSSREVAATRILNLDLENSLSLPGNDEQVFITPKVLPILSGTRVMLFRSGGGGVIVDSIEGTEEEIESPHSSAVCSVSQRAKDNFFSVDWSGNVAKWHLGDHRGGEQVEEWGFVRESESVAGSYDAQPLRLVQ